MKSEAPGWSGRYRHQASTSSGPEIGTFKKQQLLFNNHDPLNRSIGWVDFVLRKIRMLDQSKLNIGGRCHRIHVVFGYMSGMAGKIS